MIYGIQWVRDFWFFFFLFFRNIVEGWRFAKMALKMKFLKERGYKVALVKNQYDCF